MATFKIRDLMVAIRPGLPTPQRPAPLDCCDIASFQTEVVRPLNSGIGTGGCDDDSSPCDPCSYDTKYCGECTGCSARSCLCSGCTDACTVTCGACSQCTNQTCDCTAGCTATGACACTYHTNCGGSACNRSVHTLEVAQMDAGDLAKVKRQLQAEMQQIGQREKVLAAAAESQAIVPQTLAQVDALQQKLTEALEELRARKTELQKIAAPAPGTPKTTDDKE